MSISPPSSTAPTYPKSKSGYYGELGEGANAKIKFLQTVITAEELKDVTLIQDIVGSERWHVRDLFQRDVDNRRVESELLPYFKDSTKVKFFNPLTLMVLPLNRDGNVCKEVEFVEPSEVDEGEHKYKIFEKPEFFQFKVHTQNPSYSEVKWNDTKVKLVAIDGQHRMAALQRWKNIDPGAEVLKDWHIPVVILGVFKANEEGNTASVLEIVRKTFIYINSKAKPVNDARKILLNDESCNSICTQELVQAAHSNDSHPLEDRDESKVPLLFFDWRGETDNRLRGSPAAMKSITEIENWFFHYLLGEDGSDEQKIALGLEDLVPPLRTFGDGKELSHEDAAIIRARFMKTLFPGVSFLLENFSPYKEYIRVLRQKEREVIDGSDTAYHAFNKLRFGTHRASETILEHVNSQLDMLVNTLAEVKQSVLEPLLSLDIGMRGIVFAFGRFKRYFDDSKGSTSEWITYAEWFTPLLNEIYADGWFASEDSLQTDHKKILTHLAYDIGGQIENYKLEDVKKGLGALIGLLAAAKAPSLTADALENAKDDFCERIRGPIRKGFRKQVKLDLRDISMEGTEAERKSRINSEAETLVGERMQFIEQYLF